MAVWTRRLLDDPATAQQGGGRCRARHGNLRDLIGAKAAVARPAGLLSQLARTTRENACTQGVVFAARELFRMESLLWAYRAHLLARPAEVRGDADDWVLAMIEAMIEREALSRPTARPSTPGRGSSWSSRPADPADRDFQPQRLPPSDPRRVAARRPRRAGVAGGGRS